MGITIVFISRNDCFVFFSFWSNLMNSFKHKHFIVYKFLLVESNVSFKYSNSLRKN